MSHVASRRSRAVKLGLVLLALLVGVAAVLAVASGVHLTRAIGWDEAERLIEALSIEPGSTVADVGAGDGWLAVAVARHVGPAGHVFATEIEEDQREAIREAAQREELGNITVVSAEEEETGLPAGCCRIAYLRHVYHHLRAPATFNESLFASLQPEGRLGIIDFEPRGIWRWVAPDHEGRGGHGVYMKDAISELEAAGFELEHRNERWGRLGYLLVFRRPGP